MFERINVCFKSSCPNENKAALIVNACARVPRWKEVEGGVQSHFPSFPQFDCLPHKYRITAPAGQLIDRPNDARKINLKVTDGDFGRSYPDPDRKKRMG